MPNTTESECAIVLLVIGTCQGRVKVTVTLPTNLRDAAAFAVDELDAASTIADLLVNALREYLESVMIPAPSLSAKTRTRKLTFLSQDTTTYAEEVQSPFAFDKDGI